ncbi:MAG: hypothetical protein AAGD11_06270 [Planctomycetota bacterium]
MEINLPPDTEAVLQQQAAVAGLNVEQYASKLIQQEVEYQAVQEGLADVDAGRTISLEQFEKDFRQQKGMKPNS